jgi:hypothetical protein
MGRQWPAAAAAIVLAAGTARAQAQEPRPKYRPQPLNLQSQQLGVESLASLGRTRMKNGDCAGALDAFDAALRAAVAPAVNRDRGLCHEQLGHPFPAIDDYRVYLTAEPDAPDADVIRQRLASLEQEATGRSSASSDVPDGMPAAREGGEGVHAKVAGRAGQRDEMDYVDRDDDSEVRSPLRRNKGWAFAPFFAEHKWFGSASFDDAATWSECVGLQVRYSFGRSGALVLEAGYEHFNTTNIDPVTLAGLTSLVAYEFRFPLDADYDHQLFLAPGLGYQHLIATPSDPQAETTTGGAFVPRLRVGYRHMLAAAVALDVALDLGVTKYFRYANFPYDSEAETQELVALGVAFVWGL